MKTYQVVLTKSYLVNIKAESKEEARHISEFFTGDIQDISTDIDKQNNKFLIEHIQCEVNESFDCVELEDE